MALARYWRRARGASWSELEFARVVRKRDADAGGRADSIVVQMERRELKWELGPSTRPLAAVLGLVLAARVLRAIAACMPA